MRAAPSRLRACVHTSLSRGLLAWQPLARSGQGSFAAAVQIHRPLCASAAPTAGEKTRPARRRAAGSGMRSEYEGMVQKGQLVADERQAETVGQLAALLDGLGRTVSTKHEPGPVAAARQCPDLTRLAWNPRPKAHPRVRRASLACSSTALSAPANPSSWTSSSATRVRRSPPCPPAASTSTSLCCRSTGTYTNRSTPRRGLWGQFTPWGPGWRRRAGCCVWTSCRSATLPMRPSSRSCSKARSARAQALPRPGSRPAPP